MNNLSDIFDRHKKSVVDFIDGVSLAMYLQGKSDAIDEVEEAIEEHLFNSPLMNPFMTRLEILSLLEQLKEKHNDKADTSIYPEMRANKKGPAES